MRRADVINMKWLSNGKRQWARCYLTYEDILHCDASTRLKIYPNPEATRLKEKLDYLKRHHLNFFSSRP